MDRAAQDRAPQDRPAQDRAAQDRAAQDRAAQDRAAQDRAGEDRAAALVGSRCKVKVGSADGILAVVPHLLGFHPANSLVVLGIGGPHARIRLAFRYDLPDSADVGLKEDIAAHAAVVLGREHLTMAILVGYGDGVAVTSVVDVVAPALRKDGIVIHDALRVHDGRYWSYLCPDPACCPPGGLPYDPDSHPAAAALAAAGLKVHGDRSALVGTLARDAGSIEPMIDAVERARRRAGRLIEETLRLSSDADVLQPIADAGRRSVRKVVTAYRRGTEVTDLDEIAWLGFTLTDMRVRDDAWARMDPQFNEAHQRLWTHLVRMLPAEFIPAPASLLAFTAWQSGDGALASIAIERALGADPSYSMALLIADALQAGLPPSAARLSMTPKQVAASYARHRRPAFPKPPRRPS